MIYDYLWLLNTNIDDLLFISIDDLLHPLVI